MEANIIGGEAEKPKPSVTIPKEFLDPQGIKLGQHITKSISGKVKRIDEEYGVTLELDGDGEDDMDDDEFESLDDEGQKKAIKKQMDKKSKLEEFD